MTRGLEVGLVVTAGVVGGLLSVVETWANPLTYPLTSVKLASLVLIPGAKGGAAAGIGVYLLTTLNSQEMTRAFFFALTCGMAFPAVIDRGSALVATKQVANANIADGASRIEDATGQTGTVSAEKVADVKDASLRLIQASGAANEESAQAAQAAVREAAAGLGQLAAESATRAPIDALSDIANAAVANNDARTAMATLNQLRIIGAAPRTTPELRNLAIGAARNVEMKVPALRPF